MRGRKLIASILSIVLVLAAVFAGNAVSTKADLTGAIVSFNSVSNGSVWYSVNDGATWTDASGVTNIPAVKNNEQWQIQIWAVPNANYTVDFEHSTVVVNGNQSLLDFQAQTSAPINGQAGSFVDFKAAGNYLVTVEFKSNDQGGGQGGGGQGSGGGQGGPQDSEPIAISLSDASGQGINLEGLSIDNFNVNLNSLPGNLNVETKDSGTRKIRIVATYPKKITSLKVNGTDYQMPAPNQGWQEIDVPITAEAGTTESYSIVINGYETDSATGYTIMWANDGADVSGTHFDSPEVMLSNGSARIIKVYDNDSDMNDISSGVDHISEGCVDQNGRGYVSLSEGNVVIFEFVPKYGYQLTSVSANGTALEPQETTNQYKYIMPDTNIHFTASFSPTADVVKSSAAKVKSSGNNISLASGELREGSAQLSVTDVSPANSSAFAEVADEYDVQSIVDIDLNQVFYKGKNNDTDVWKNEMHSLSGNATITLALNITNMSEDIVLIHEVSAGTFETIPVTVNQNGTITFETNSFSNYAIAMKGTGNINPPTPASAPSSSDNATNSASVESTAEAKSAVVDVVNATDSTNNFQGATLETVTMDVLEGVFTPEEKVLIAAGVSPKIWADVQDISESVSEANKAIVTNKLPNTYKVANYLDINLFKQVGNSASSKISVLPNGKVSIKFALPSDLVKAGRDYKIIRIHEGVATILDATFDSATGLISFESDQFSTYAIIYTDEAQKSPKTNNGFEMGTLVILSLLGIAYAGYCGRRKRA